MPNAVALMQDYKRPGELTARSDRRITRKPVKNLERPGTVKWGEVELNIHGDTQCILIMHSDKRGIVAKTSKHLERVLGKRIVGSSFWEALNDEGGGTDKITLTDLANQISLSRRHTVENLLVSGSRLKLVESIEARPLEDRNNNKSFYFIQMSFQKDDAGKEKPEADELLVKWMRSKNPFSTRYDMRSAQIQSGDRDSVIARNQNKLMNMIKWNEDLNAKHQQELQSDPVLTVTQKLCTSGDHYLQTKSGRACLNVSEGKQRSAVLDSEGCAKLIGSKELADPTDPLNVAPGLAKIHDKLNQKNAQNQEVDYFGRKTDPAKMADLNKVRHDIHDTLTNKFV